MISRLPVAGLSAILLLAGCAETGQTPIVDPAATPGATAAPSGESPSGAGPAPAADPANGLGVSQEQIIAAFGEQGLDPNAFEAQTLQDGRQVVAAAYPPTAQRQVLWVAIFGPSAAPHTVRVDYFPANARGGEPELIGQAMDGLMTTLFPEWPDAAEWPEQAGARAWQETAAIAQNDPGSRRVPIFEGQREAVWLAALGVPPQVVSYVFTTREVCRPSAPGANFYEGYSSCR